MLLFVAFIGAHFNSLSSKFWPVMNPSENSTRYEELSEWFMVPEVGIGASPFGRSRPSALLTSANILGGLFLASLGAKLHSIPLSIFLERVMGIEPTLRAWEARVLPLNY